MAISFTIFPAIISETNLHFIDLIFEGKEDPSGISRISWTFLSIITLWNVSDTIGKWFAGRLFHKTSDKLGHILTYSRIIFIATANLIKFKIGPDWLVGPLNGDWFKLLHMILFGASNGFCLSLNAIKCPSKTPSDKKDDVSIFIGVFLVFGVVIGALISIPADVRI